MSQNRLLALLLALFVVAAWWPLKAQSQPVPQAAPGTVNFPLSTVRNVSTLGAATVSPANVGRFAFATATGGLVVADASTGLPLPDGKNLPVNVRTEIPRANVAAALGRFARKALPLLGTGVALYDLGQELGFGLDNSGGTVVVTKPDPALCLTAPCYRFDSLHDGITAYNNSPGAAAAWLIGKTVYGCRVDSASPNFNASTGALSVSIYGKSTPTFQTACSQTVNHLSQTRSVDAPGAVIPSSVTEFENAISSKPSWAPSSPLARAFRDATAAGESTAVPPSSITGPASTPGPVKTTTDAVNNTTKTETERFDHSYSGPTATTTINITSVTVDNSTGATISNTTTTTQPTLPDTPQEEDEGTPTDTALPGQPELYTPEYPEGLTGVWNSKQSQLQALPILDLLGDLMPNVAASGTCPSWTLDMDLYIVDYGSHVIAIPCWIWDFGKVVIICSALLLSRRLIFGG